MLGNSNRLSPEIYQFINHDCISEGLGLVQGLPAQGGGIGSYFIAGQQCAGRRQHFSAR
jgi:hypothetical protein